MTAAVKSPMDLDQPYSLSKEQIERYRRDGHIKLKNVFTPDVLAHYGRAISKKVAELNTLDIPMEQRTTYQKAFIQIMNLWTKDAVVKEFVFGKRCARIAAELMGCRGVRVYHDQALYKEAHGGKTPWHTDQSYWPVATDNTVTAWIPLQPTPMEMGPLAFSTGSHRHHRSREQFEVSDESDVAISKQVLESGLPIDDAPFDLGEVSYHSGWTYHRAGANNTDRPREVMTIIYVDADAKVAEPKSKAQGNDLNSWLPGLKPGDAINSPINPELYRIG